MSQFDIKTSTSNSTNHLSVPTSISLSIPFFSRSSSSSNSSSTLTSSDLDTSFSDISSPGLTSNYPYGLTSQSLRKLNSSSSIRPELKKMPNWSSNSSINLNNSNHENSKNSKDNNKTWSPRTSIDYMRRQSNESESGYSNFDAIEDESNGNERRKSLIKVDFGTWGRKPKIVFGSTSSTKLSIKRKSLSSISKLKIKSTSLAITKTTEQSISSSRVITDEIDAKDDNVGIPLQRVWAREGQKHRTEEQIERERRGSDWPPTQSREMVLDLSRIPTFTGENLDNNGAVSPINEVGDNDGGKNKDIINTGLPYNQRVDTPLEMPFIPKLHLRKSHSSSILSPVLDNEDEEKEEESYKHESKANGETEAEGEGKEKEEKEEFFTPCFVPPSLFTKTPYPSRFESNSKSAMRESPKFHLSIFSPRPIQPHTPVLKGIIDLIPISPLELPLLSSSLLSELKQSFPSPILTKNPPNSPSPSSPLVVMPIPRKGIPNQSIESVLNPPKSPIIPPNSNSSFTNPYTLGRKCSLNERRPSRPSSAFEATPILPKRRMSLIVKPSILPCPTPPSLLTSPKTLGNEYIPSSALFSPSSISPTNINFMSDTGGSISGLPIRRGRGSLKLKLPPSHFANSSGLGFGPTKNDEDEKAKEKEEHVPTPGTFGLEGEGEREKVAQDVINPYFD